MIPKLNRGFSFKGLAAYLRDGHQSDAARLANDERPPRVGFAETLNFHGDAAMNNPVLAGRIMALTWQSREAIKKAAGIAPGGDPAKSPPVWHSSLSWAKGEQVDRAEMMRAAGEFLKGQGLDLDKGYQTIVVQHVDTDHPHVHIVVNLVHPETGKQANPFRDKQKAQAWARDYEKQRGAVHCHDREAKYAAIDRERAATRTRADFTEAAKGGPPRTGQSRRGDPEHDPRPDQFGRSRDKARGEAKTASPHVPYQQWKAQQAQNHAARLAAERLRTELNDRYTAMRSRHDAAFQRRQEEIRQQRADRDGGRDAIYQKYASALDAVWNPQPGGKPQDDYSRAWEMVRKVQDARQAVFDHNERSAFGRVRNALKLSEGLSLFMAARLALNATERRQRFETSQRKVVKKYAPPRQEKRRPTAATPEPRRAQAERLKAMRAAELAAHERQSNAAAASMAARHQFERKAEVAQRQAFAAAKATAWAQHSATHGQQKSAEQEKVQLRKDDRQDAGQSREVDKEDVAREAQPDRYGRSRDRKPRQSRRRGDATTGTEGGATPENQPVETANESGQGNEPGTLETTPAPSYAEQEAERTPEQWEQIERTIADQDRAAIKDGGRERNI